MIKTLIIEDEQPARELMKKYLQPHNEIELVGESDNGFDGLKAIKELQPDLVFLDIQLPKLTGFEMLELMEHKPMIVFATAYDEYAIKAFEMNAVDYLLKPYSKERFDAAIEKVMERFRLGNQKTTAIDKVMEVMNEKPEIIDRVVVKASHKIKVIPVTEIIYLESQDDYVMIYTREARFLKEKTMKFFESHLDPSVFLRIHRSYMVRIDAIKHLEHYDKESYIAILHNGAKIKVSQSGYKNLKDKLHF